MITICRQGNGHYTSGLNNQDFYYMDKNLKLITDGCSEGKFSEVGTRLFAQLFSNIKEEDRLDVEKFDENVKNVFSKICSILPTDEGKRIDAIANNLLFTIIACFELEDKFVVKSIGDGYIITVNDQDSVSYIRLNYGKTPPYFGYNFLQTQTYAKPLNFKIFEFPKSKFKKVGVASDGLAPIVDKRISEDFSVFILGKHSIYTPEGVINSNHAKFSDDITILI